jgi:putative membrane protein
MFKLPTAFAAAAAMLLAFTLPTALAQEKGAKESGAKKDALSRQDRNALQKMAQSDMAEIEAGKVAAQKGSNPEVKKYGEHMVQEHTRMLEEGSKVAKAKGVKPPAGPDKKHQSAVKKLQELSGEEFDRRYMAQMVKDHEDALELAEKTAKDAKDAEVKAHAQKGAPHIKEHLAMARKLHQSLSASAGGNAKKDAPESKRK